MVEHFGVRGIGFVFWDWDTGEVCYVDRLMLKQRTWVFLNPSLLIQSDSTFSLSMFSGLVSVLQWPLQQKTLSTSFDLIEMPTTQSRRRRGNLHATHTGVVETTMAILGNLTPAKSCHCGSVDRPHPDQIRLDSDQIDRQILSHVDIRDR